MVSVLSLLSNPPEDGVQIWTSHLEKLSPVELSEIGASLDAGEQARASRFHFERDRQLYVASRGLLRRLLGDALDQPASAVLLTYGEHGKPALGAGTGGNRTLHFNISHSAGWAMFALAWDREVGIDLESAARLKGDANNLAGLAARVLSARELTIWQALPEGDKREAAFLRAWTRKEAFAKAVGGGLFEHLVRTDVALDAKTPTPSLVLQSSESGQAPRTWTLHDIKAPDGFFAALALEQKCGQPA